MNACWHLERKEKAMVWVFSVNGRSSEEWKNKLIVQITHPRDPLSSKKEKEGPIFPSLLDPKFLSHSKRFKSTK